MNDQSLSPALCTMSQRSGVLISCSEDWPPKLGMLWHAKGRLYLQLNLEDCLMQWLQSRAISCDHWKRTSVFKHRFGNHLQFHGMVNIRIPKAHFNDSKQDKELSPAICGEAYPYPRVSFSQQIYKWKVNTPARITPCFHGPMHFQQYKQSTYRYQTSTGLHHKQILINQNFRFHDCCN